MREEAALTIRLLGSLQVRVRGELLPPLRSRRGYWVLALLLLRGRAVERSWLAETLWPNSAHPQALSSLRRTLTDLRAALGPEGGRLLAPTSHTLDLDLEGAWVDLPLFDAGIRSEALSVVEGALPLYRGALLEGCTEEWIWSEREKRHQGYLNALERLADAALLRADFPAAARAMRLAVAADPIRESAHRTLMDVLARAGDHAAATAVYRELRERLHRDVNAEPGVETRALYERIRAAARRAADKPVAIPAAPPTGSSVRLPRPLTGLIGRAHEADEIRKLLSDCRLVTLTGAGGVGKTRLAIHAAEALAPVFPDGVYFIDLAPLTGGGSVLQAVAGALGVPESSVHGLPETLHAELAGRRTLLLLDNCEHLIAASAELAELLLRRAPELRVLATSRQPLGITGEVIRPVHPLPTPDPEGLSAAPDAVEAALEYAAVRLFVERAAAAVPEFRLTGETLTAVARICRRLDGIPLALELAAARLRVFTAREIETRLDDRFRLLCGGSRTALPRQQTLRALLDWSYDLLTPREQTLLRALSVFAGSWTLAEAEALAGVEVLEPLLQLVDHSLVYADRRGGEATYRLLESTRAYGRARLAECGEAEVVTLRHARYFAGVAEEARAHLEGPRQVEWMERLDAALEDLNAARDRLIAAGEADAVLRLGITLGQFWRRRGYFTEGRRALEAILDQVPDRTPTRGRLMRVLASLVTGTGNLAESRRIAEEALLLHQQQGDEEGAAGARNQLGKIAEAAGEYAVARAHFGAALDYYQRAGDPFGVVMALNNLGGTMFGVKDFLAARGHFLQCLSLNQELGNVGGIAWTHVNLGITHHGLHSPDEAEAHFRKALAIFAHLRHRYGLALCAEGLAAILILRGNGDEARAVRWVSAARRERERLGADRGPTMGIDEALERLRAELGPERYAQAWRGGREEPWERVVREIEAAERTAAPASQRPSS